MFWKILESGSSSGKGFRVSTIPSLSRRQVDLHTLKVLTGIATQGAISKETLKAYYVTTFKLEVSTNGEDWMVYRHGKNHKVGPDSGTNTQTEARRGVGGGIWMLLADTYASCAACWRKNFEMEYMCGKD